ncbi:MAG TPA: hypothetical protein V6C78_15815 [Crinalium sp.]
MQRTHMIGNTEIDLNSRKISLMNDFGEILFNEAEAIAVCTKVLQLFQIDVPLNTLDELTQQQVKRILSYP